MKKITLEQLALKIDAKIIGDPNTEVSTLASTDKAQKGQITFLSNSRYRDKLDKCQASAVILKEQDQEFFSGNCLIVADPYLAYAYVAQILDTTPLPADSIADSASISSDAKIGGNVSIGANAVIESGVELAENVKIGAGCFIGKNAKLGSNTKIWANVSIYHNVEIGSNCLIQSGAVIGADGFGYANDKGKWIKIPQLGTVRIGDGVEIGASTTIDRGAIEDTIISDGVIIDNQCQIAHNVEIGQGTAIAGGTIMAGSLRVGKYCIIGGASVFNGHMEIADKVSVTGMSMVTSPIKEPGLYSSGVPAQSNIEWRRNAARFLKLDAMYKRLRKVEKKLAQEKQE